MFSKVLVLGLACFAAATMVEAKKKKGVSDTFTTGPPPLPLSLPRFHAACARRILTQPFADFLIFFLW